LIIKELRIYQWLKNLLVIIPLLLAHRLDSGLIGQSVLAFFAFGMTASFVYVLNDLLDLTSDRLHPRKRKRPLASGALSIPSTVIFSPLLLLGGATIAVFLLPANFAAALGVYFVLTTFYSFVLKRIVIVDVSTAVKSRLCTALLSSCGRSRCACFSGFREFGLLLIADKWTTTLLFSQAKIP
jgi:4-hydroxybenzoate polyprenyltransferase